MRINSIRLYNWKCFEEELNLDFSTIEIFSFPNGSGKTALLEAIGYGLYGKVDKPFETYQNHPGQTNVSICFEIDGTNYQINRAFPKTEAVLYKDSQPFIEGITEIFNYINDIAPYNVVKRLWFKGDIAENEVLTFKFFKDEILEEELKEPKAIYKYLNQEKRHLNQEFKGIVLENDLRRKRDVEYEIKEIQDTLKERVSVPDFKYRQALQARDACEKAKTLKKPSITLEEIARWKQIDEAQVQKAIEQEAQKYVDDTLSKISETTLRSAFNANEQAKHCVICDGEWKEERAQYVKDILDKGFRSDELIKSLKEKLAFKHTYQEQEITEANAYYELKAIYEACPNFKKTIADYQKRNDALWQKQEDLQNELQRIIKNEANAERACEIQKAIDLDTKQMAFVKEYIDKTTASYTALLFSKANDILTSINPEYTGLCLQDNELALLKGDRQLFVSQLSRGEKTVLALALICTIRDMFTPDAPLIFDESFAALSKNNTDGVIKNLKDSFSQVFIVTHSMDWTDYQDYDFTKTNIRTAWKQKVA